MTLVNNSICLLGMVKVSIFGVNLLKFDKKSRQYDPTNTPFPPPWHWFSSVITKQKLEGNQCNPPSFYYYCLLLLCIVQRPLSMMHPWLQWFCSKLVKTSAGFLDSGKVPTILNGSGSRTRAILVEKGYKGHLGATQQSLIATPTYYLSWYDKHVSRQLPIYTSNRYRATYCIIYLESHFWQPHK